MTEEDTVLLDLNNPVFESNLFPLPKNEKIAALDTFRKLMLMTWVEVYCDKGLRWKKIVNVEPADGIHSIYSLRITQSCRATAYRQGHCIRFLTIILPFLSQTMLTFYQKY